MSGLRTLQRYTGGSVRQQDVERCELCAQPIGPQHRHLVDLEKRGLSCACRGCALLFVEPKAGARFRTVPDRVLADPGFTLSESTWSTLQIPVRLAFMFLNSKLNRWAAHYPGPAGVTEAALPDAWNTLVSNEPLLAAIAPDVEALLCWGPPGQTTFESYLVPIDASYELVARVRRSWHGLHGGLARREIADHFARLRSRSRTLRPKQTEVTS